MWSWGMMIAIIPEKTFLQEQLSYPHELTKNPPWLLFGYKLKVVCIFSYKCLCRRTELCWWKNCFNSKTSFCRNIILIYVSSIRNIQYSGYWQWSAELCGAQRPAPVWRYARRKTNLHAEHSERTGYKTKVKLHFEKNNVLVFMHWFW